MDWLFGQNEQLFGSLPDGQLQQIAESLVGVTARTASRNDFRVTFEDGNTINTGFNGTLEEAEAYYLGKYFNPNLGEADRMVKAVKVEQLGDVVVGS